MHLYSSIVLMPKIGKTRSFLLMKGDIGMANYEKQVEQEAAYPIPISLYNCYRTVRHVSLSCNSCTLDIYRDGVCNGVCSLLFHFFFS